ncbi:MAG: lyase family protein [Candidatus Marsarchaeota archaeon]
MDGRYRGETGEVGRYLSERGLFLERASVELLYLKALEETRALGFEASDFDPASVIASFPPDWYGRVKAIEAEVGHDVKAIELFLRERLNSSGLSRLSPYVHIGLTSDDVNNLAYSRLLLYSLRDLIGRFSSLVLSLCDLAEAHRSDPLLARTHGVPAEPTTFGKEMAVYAWRLASRLLALSSARPYGKLGGAVGNHNALHFLRPDFDWVSFSKDFVNSLGLDYAPLTKQTAPNEGMSDLLHQLMLLNYVLQELARDLWLYNALGLVHFERKGVSSSTMPHKVNPVDLEDAEGQVDASNSLLSLLAYRLVQTRLQRDLSDSPVRRLLGQALAHSAVACGRVIKSIGYMRVDAAAMRAELEAHPEVLSEAVQVSLRAQGDERGYEEVREGLRELDSLARSVKGEIGKRLVSISPSDYVGLAPGLADLGSARAREMVKEAKEKTERWPYPLWAPTDGSSEG